MSKNILYYSTYCKNCDKLLNILNKSNPIYIKFYKYR